MASKSSGRGPTNVQLAKKLEAASAKAHDANAQERLVRAQIEAKGKQVYYDYSGPIPKPKVVDVPRGR